jgi:predicted transcriptional regulator
MPRKPSSQPNDVELAILRAMWRRGSASVRTIHDDLSRHRKTGYTSTLKMMQVMCAKGLLKRQPSGRPRLYRPAIPEAQTQRAMLSDLIHRVFDGSARKLVMRAVETHHISAAEAAEIRDLLDRTQREEP